MNVLSSRRSQAIPEVPWTADPVPLGTTADGPNAITNISGGIGVEEVSPFEGREGDGDLEGDEFL